MPQSLTKFENHLKRFSRESIRLSGLNWYQGDGGRVKTEVLGLSQGRFLLDPPSRAPVIDLSGWTLLPGLCDAHLHLFGEAQRRLRVDLAGLTDREEIWDRLDRGPGEGPLVATGWDESEWDDPRFPERAELEARYPGREVMLIRVCGHVVIASGPALARLATQPIHGDLERGILIEGDANALRRLFVLPSEQLVAEAKILSRELAAEGLCTVTEMGASRLLELMALLDDEFPLRVEFYHAQFPGELSVLPRPGSGLHRALGRKFFLDGSIGGKSAALNIDYLGGGRGELLWKDDDLAAALTDTFAKGRKAALHAIGTRAIEQALQVLERVKAPPASARIEHLETASQDQLESMAQRGLGAGFQPNFLDRWGRPKGLYEQRLGSDYRRHFPGPGDLRDAGLSPSYGTDGMPRDLWGAMRAAVDPVLFGDKADDPQQVLAAVCADAAALAGRDAERGRVADGMSADFALYDCDPLANNFDKKIKPALTVLAGRITASQYKSEISS